MHVERVQQWVVSALVMTVAVVFTGGLVLLAGVSERPGALPALLIVAALVMAGATAACRMLLQRSPLSVWLVLGLVPVLAGIALYGGR